MFKRSLDRRIEEQNKRKNRPRPLEDEETEEEMDFPRFEPLNVRKSVFDGSAVNRTAGINTAPSVFEKAAVFHTQKEPQS